MAWLELFELVSSLIVGEEYPNTIPLTIAARQAIIEHMATTQIRSWGG